MTTLEREQTTATRLPSIERYLLDSLGENGESVGDTRSTMNPASAQSHDRRVFRSETTRRPASATTPATTAPEAPTASTGGRETQGSPSPTAQRMRVLYSAIEALQSVVLVSEPDPED